MLLIALNFENCERHLIMQDINPDRLEVKTCIVEDETLACGIDQKLGLDGERERYLTRTVMKMKH